MPDDSQIQVPQATGSQPVDRNPATEGVDMDDMSDLSVGGEPPAGIPPGPASVPPAAQPSVPPPPASTPVPPGTTAGAPPTTGRTTPSSLLTPEHRAVLQKLQEKLEEDHRKALEAQNAGIEERIAKEMAAATEELRKVLDSKGDSTQVSAAITALNAKIAEGIREATVAGQQKLADQLLEVHRRVLSEQRTQHAEQIWTFIQALNANPSIDRLLTELHALKAATTPAGEPDMENPENKPEGKTEDPEIRVREKDSIPAPRKPSVGERARDLWKRTPAWKPIAGLLLALTALYFLRPDFASWVDKKVTGGDGDMCVPMSPEGLEKYTAQAKSWDPMYSLGAQKDPTALANVINDAAGKPYINCDKPSAPFGSAELVNDKGNNVLDVSACRLCSSLPAPKSAGTQ